MISDGLRFYISDDGEMMSAQTHAIPTIPRDVACRVNTHFDRDNFYVKVGNNLADIFYEVEVGALWEPTLPSALGGILPVVTFFEFIEHLTDAQTVEALHTRVEWKFALHLPVHALVFRQDALCQFRRGILADPARQAGFQKLIDRLFTLGPPCGKSFEDFHSLKLVMTVCAFNRLGELHEAVCQAIEALAFRYPLWLKRVAQPHWYGRYNHIARGAALTAAPRRQELSIQEIDADIHHLLTAAGHSAPLGIGELPEIRNLECLWKLQFEDGKWPSPVSDAAPLEPNGCDHQNPRERRPTSSKNI